MVINDIKCVKGAYGFENLGCCSFSSKAGRATKSFLKLSNYMIDSSKSTWIAIYIPQASRKFRKEAGLPEITNYEGYISAFQELTPQRGIDYKEWGINDRWDYGIPAKRIFAFKKPKIHITQIFDDYEIKNFYAATLASAAHFLTDEQEKSLISRVSTDDLVEIEVEEKFINLYPKLNERFQKNLL